MLTVGSLFSGIGGFDLGFEDTVIRRLPDKPGVFLMNRQKRGWGEYAIPYRSEQEVETFFDVSVGNWAVDEHGEYAPVAVSR